MIITIETQNAELAIRKGTGHANFCVATILAQVASCRTSSCEQRAGIDVRLMAAGPFCYRQQKVVSRNLGNLSSRRALRIGIPLAIYYHRK